MDQNQQITQVTLQVLDLQMKWKLYSERDFGPLSNCPVRFWFQFWSGSVCFSVWLKVSNSFGFIKLLLCGDSREEKSNRTRTWSITDFSQCSEFFNTSKADEQERFRPRLVPYRASDWVQLMSGGELKVLVLDGSGLWIHGSLSSSSGWYVVWQLFLSKFKFLRELVGDAGTPQAETRPSEPQHPAGAPTRTRNRTARQRVSFRESNS